MPRPDDATLRLADVAGEAALLLGGGTAILLQLAHPAVARGVARHSDFADRPLDRLFGTLDYVYTVAFGDEAMRTFVVRGVNRAHAPVRESASAPAYNAFDPGLQLWVAATLYYAATEVQNRILTPLDDDSAEAVYRDYSALGALLQMPMAHWPAGREAFREYWERSLAGLRGGPDARGVIDALFRARALPLPARMLMPLVRLVSTGLLPPSARTVLGLPWDERQEARFTRVIRLARAVYPRLPARLRHWPRERSLARVRRAMGGQGSPGRQKPGR